MLWHLWIKAPLWWHQSDFSHVVSKVERTCISFCTVLFCGPKIIMSTSKATIQVITGILLHSKEKAFAQQEQMISSLQQHWGRTFLRTSSWKHQEEIFYQPPATLEAWLLVKQKRCLPLINIIVYPILVIKQTSKTNMLLGDIFWCWVVVIVNNKTLVLDKLDVFHLVPCNKKSLIYPIEVFFFSSI